MRARFVVLSLILLSAGCGSLPERAFRVPDGFALEPAAGGEGPGPATTPDGEVIASIDGRIVHQVPGGRYGTGVLDNLPPMSDRGDGPLTVYNAHAYPEQYWGGLFHVDRGELLFSRIAHCGATLCLSDTRTFAAGNAPIDALGLTPDGKIWISAAGRRYQIAYRPGLLPALYRPVPDAPEPTPNRKPTTFSVMKGLNDIDPFIRRQALEGMVRLGLSPATHESFAPVGIVFAALNDKDRFVRHAARMALERYPRESWESMALREPSPVAAPEGFLALTRTANGDNAALDRIFPVELRLLRDVMSAEGLRALELTAQARTAPIPADIKERARDVLATAPASLAREAEAARRAVSR